MEKKSWWWRILSSRLPVVGGQTLDQDVEPHVRLIEF